MRASSIAASSLGVLAGFFSGCILDTSGLTGRSPDASTESDGGDGGACAAGAHRFCDDFDDRDAPQDPRWSTSPTSSGAGELRIDATDARSKPHSLFSSVAAHSGDGKQQRALGVYVDLAGGSKLRIELDLQVSYDASQVSGGKNAFGWLLSIDDGTHFQSLDIEKDDIAFDMTSDGGTGSPNLSLPGVFPPNGAWHHVAIEMVFSATNGGATITVDGVKAQSLGLNTLGASPLGRFLVTVGVMTDATSGAWPEAHARYDNVSIDY